jgi:DNA modification methylase
MDTPEQGANIGAYTDFPGDIIRIHEEFGFEYLPRICIWKEPLGVRNRTMAKSLYHKQIVEDSTLTCVAAADYLIPMRKKGINQIPVVHPVGLTHYAGERTVPDEYSKYRGWTGNQIENRYSHWIWRQYASCFWDDIRIGNVLPYKESKEEEDEKHVHPLQLDVIERACVLWTNIGETILTPFMGVGSEVYGSILNGRKAIGIELKTSYYNQAVQNIPMALKKQQEQLDLFN